MRPAVGLLSECPGIVESQVPAELEEQVPAVLGDVGGQDFVVDRRQSRTLGKSCPGRLGPMTVSESDLAKLLS
jgi:hypothetical protein